MQINNCDKYGNGKDYMSKHEDCKIFCTEYLRAGEKLCLNVECEHNTYSNLFSTIGGSNAKGL